MKWIKISDQYPPFDLENIVVYDAHSNKLVILEESWKGNSWRSIGYVCNDKKCSWIFDDCCCDYILDEDDYWVSQKEFESTLPDAKGE